MRNFKRIIATIITVATLTVMASFVTVSANASAVTPKATSVSATMVTMMKNDTMAINIPIVMAGNQAQQAPAGNSPSDSYDADSAFSTIVSFFAKWMGRVGGLVAFVGAIMFALAIKNNDAEQKQAGLLTLVGGFAAIAITAATSWFGF